MMMYRGGVYCFEQWPRHLFFLTSAFSLHAATNQGGHEYSCSIYNL